LIVFVDDELERDRLVANEADAISQVVEICRGQHQEHMSGVRDSVELFLEGLPIALDDFEPGLGAGIGRGIEGIEDGSGQLDARANVAREDGGALVSECKQILGHEASPQYT
jgi:hypothetical protein